MASVLSWSLGFLSSLNIVMRLTQQNACGISYLRLLGEVIGRVGAGSLEAGLVLSELLKGQVSECVHGHLVVLLSLEVTDVVRQDPVQVLGPYFLRERGVNSDIVNTGVCHVTRCSSVIGWSVCHVTRYSSVISSRYLTCLYCRSLHEL